MHASHKRPAVLAAGLILAVVFIAPPILQGDEWNLKTVFSVSHQFEVPNKTLDANTKYVIRLLDSPSTRNVVQIFNEDESELMTMFMAIPEVRSEPEDETVFTFMETEEGYPKVVRSWFYPGRLTGLEFIYPEEQKQQIAAHLKGARTAESGSVARVEPATEEPALEAEEEAVLPEEPAADIKTDTEIQRSKPTAEQPPAEQQLEEQPRAEEVTPSKTPATEEPEELPETAGELPLIGFIGMLCLGVGLGLKVFSPKSS